MLKKMSILKIIILTILICLVCLNVYAGIEETFTGSSWEDLNAKIEERLKGLGYNKSLQEEFDNAKTITGGRDVKKNYEVKWETTEKEYTAKIESTAGPGANYLTASYNAKVTIEENNKETSDNKWVNSGINHSTVSNKINRPNSNSGGEQTGNNDDSTSKTTTVLFTRQAGRMEMINNFIKSILQDQNCPTAKIKKYTDSRESIAYNGNVVQDRIQWTYSYNSYSAIISIIKIGTTYQLEIKLTMTIDERTQDPIKNPSFYEPTDTTGNNTEFINIGNIIIGTIRALGTVIAVISLTVIGLRYMFGSIAERATYKETMVPYLIGAVMLFTIPNILGIIYDLVKAIK